MAARRNTGRFIHPLGLFLIASVICDAWLSAPSRAAIVGPYMADTDTLHLWHLDEADPGPAAPAAGVIGSWNLNLQNGATLGNASYTGFGTALNTPTTTSNADGGTRAVSALTGANGAFTFEALIKTSSISTLQEIISMESTSQFASDRPFQFYIGASGELGFVNIAGTSGVQLLSAAIPTTGPDAFVANQWFHVAVTYNGAESTANNLAFYWTRVDPTRTTANLIGSGTMTDDMPANSAIFEIGNDGRDTTDSPPGGHPVLGSMDEVRISDVARTADQFIFTNVPEPTSLCLLLAGGMLLLSRDRKRPVGAIVSES